MSRITKTCKKKTCGETFEANAVDAKVAMLCPSCRKASNRRRSNAQNRALSSVAMNGDNQFSGRMR